MENTMTEQTQEMVENQAEDTTAIETTEEGQTTEATGEDTQVADAEKHFEETGTWPEDTPPWVKKAVNRATRQKYDAITKAEAAEREAEYWRNKATKEQPQQVAKPESAKPTREQFDFDDEKYIDALTDWKIEERERTRHEKQAAKEAEKTEYDQLKTFEQRRVDTVSRGREKYDDFDEVVFSLPASTMSQEMATAIFETDSPADISYYLGTHPDVAERIAKLPPMKKAIELGKIEGVMKVSTKKTTNAPPPIKPLGQGGSKEKSPATMSNEEYRIWSAKNRRAL